MRTKVATLELFRFSVSRVSRMYGRYSGNNESKVYVGNLPADIRARDLEDLFYKYGKIVDVDLHNRRGPPFAFIEFEDPRCGDRDRRDAEDSVRGRDGYVFDGYRIRVEFPRSSSRGSRGGDGGGGGGGGGYGGGRKFRSRGGHQLLVSGLPPTGSWQDVKDHFREAGDVVYADVYKDGTGIIEFSRYEHMKRALRDLDDSKFRSHEGETAYIRVKEARPSRSPSPRGRSYRSRSRSRSRSH